MKVTDWQKKQDSGPDPLVKGTDPRIRIRTRRSRIRKTAKTDAKLSEIWSGMFIPDPASQICLVSIPDPGAKKAPDPECGSATLVVRTSLIGRYLKMSYTYSVQQSNISEKNLVKKWFENVMRLTGGLVGDLEKRRRLRPPRGWAAPRNQAFQMEQLLLLLQLL